MKYVAFDLGASSGKLFEGVLRKGRLELTPVHSFANGIVRLGDGLYWDFMGIWREMCAGLRKAEQRGHVDALGVDSFNNDFSLIGSDGALLAPVRAYRDPRTLRHWDAIFAKISQRELYMRSGNQIAPFNTLMHLAAMGLDGQRHMLEGARHLLMLPDLIGYYVTAREGIEYTLAAETELMDLRDRTWIDALFRLYDIPKRLMPPLRLPGTVLGPSTAGFNADCGIRGLQFVNVCEHDTASAYLSSPLTSDCQRHLGAGRRGGARACDRRVHLCRQHRQRRRPGGTSPRAAQCDGHVADPGIKARLRTCRAALFLP